MQSNNDSLPRRAWAKPDVAYEQRFELEGWTDMRFYKTKLCTFWEEGRCSRGAACKYAHGEEELQSAPNLEKTAMCNQIENYGVCSNPACKFAHSVDELRVVGKFLKTAMNKYVRSHGCRMSGDAIMPMADERYVCLNDDWQVPMVDDQYQRSAVREHWRAARRAQMQENCYYPHLPVTMLPMQTASSISWHVTPVTDKYVSMTEEDSPAVAYLPISSIQDQSTDQGFVCSCGVVNEEPDANFCKDCGSKRPASEMPMQLAIAFMPCVSSIEGMTPVQA